MSLLRNCITVVKLSWMVSKCVATVGSVDHVDRWCAALSTSSVCLPYNQVYGLVDESGRVEQGSECTGRRPDLLLRRAS
eukprot:205663-Chlamydomonas_euryale.AAC.1